MQRAVCWAHMAVAHRAAAVDLAPRFSARSRTRGGWRALSVPCKRHRRFPCACRVRDTCNSSAPAGERRGAWECQVGVETARDARTVAPGRVDTLHGACGVCHDGI